MAARLRDVAFASIGLIILGPLFALAALGIWLSSDGPLLFRAKRVGLNGKRFCMYKFRTMHVDQPVFASTITARDDPRVFAFGAWLRRLKIDELPQLVNILKGEMSVVGPRPEDPSIVDRFYAPPHLETLRILPGLASPGTLYYYTHGEQRVGTDDPERYYVERLLPTKLALDMAYARQASFVYDMKIIVRTIGTIASMALGRREFPDPPEMARAAGFVYPTRQATRQE